MRARRRSPIRLAGGLALVLAAAAAACTRAARAPRAADGPAANAASHAAADVPAHVRRPAAVLADSLFWRTLHAGAYDSIPRAIVALQAAYLEDPADAVTASHIAFLHTWRVVERSRQARLLPTITDDAILARVYFEQARRKGAYDARLHGFESVVRMAEGAIHRDTAMSAEGLREARASVTAWPEFNLFTIGYTLSTRPDTSALFREALDMQWRTLELCRRAAVDRGAPAFQAGLADGAAEPDARKRRACYNSWIAPHNIEGFSLNLGDMVLRTGDWRAARNAYALARQSSTYDGWAYRDTLEARIEHAERDAEAFRREPGRMMAAGRFACVACHQGR